jgi:4'-phosphopantetheinyl transferase
MDADVGAVVDTDVAVDTVQAWQVSGDDLSRADVADLFDVLDAEERRRADSRTLAEGRRRFIIAHGAVRFIVARHLGAPPAEIAWRTGRHGKPELADPWTGVHVNISHSGTLCLIALSASRHVGVDVQQILPGLDTIAMARRYFSPGEAAIVAEDCDAGGRAEEFARLWARKEAVVKADGGRLTQVLPLPALGDGEAVVEVPKSMRYRVADIPAPPGYRAAVALAGADRFTVELDTWKP